MCAKSAALPCDHGGIYKAASIRALKFVNQKCVQRPWIVRE
jgi:hypothetical protein